MRPVHKRPLVIRRARARIFRLAFRGAKVKEQYERAIGAISELAARMPGVEMPELKAFMEERLLFSAVSAMPEFHLQHFLQTVADKAREVVAARMGALGVGTDPEKPFDVWVVSGVSYEIVHEVGRLPRPVGTLGQVAREGRVLRALDIQRDPAFLGLPAGHPVVTSFLGVPIRYQGNHIGSLYVANKEGATFSDDDRRVLELFSAQVGIVLAQGFLLWTAASQALRIAEILRSAPDGLFFIDAATHHVQANAACDRLFGASTGRGMDMAHYAGSFCWPDGRPMTLEDLPSTMALHGRSTSGVELQIRRPDGTRVPIWKRAEPVRDPLGRLVGVVVAVRDLTTVKELERLREQFTAMVAHDLRNPIQTILVQTAMLKRIGTIPAAYEVAFDRIERSAQRLGQMTHDLLDAARIELAQVKLSRHRVDVGQAVRALVEQTSSNFGPRPIAIDILGEPGEAWIDPVRFEQILINLLDNAAKYSPPGSPIEVCVAARDQGVEVAVVDHGVGIAEEEMGRLFDRFYQGSRAREAKSGLGLGLHIVRGLIEAHGGRINVESRVGIGSTFRAWFPSLPPLQNPTECNNGSCM
jgi:PAS domain S-box-containing protein